MCSAWAGERAKHTHTDERECVNWPVIEKQAESEVATEDCPLGQMLWSRPHWIGEEELSDPRAALTTLTVKIHEHDGAPHLSKSDRRRRQL